MPKRAKRDTIAFIKQKRHTRSYEWWQALRRHPEYRIAVQDCFREVQTLHARWVERRQALGPYPPPPSRFPEMHAWRNNSSGDMLRYLYWYEPERCPKSLPEVIEFLKIMDNYKENLRRWSKRYEECQSHIDACFRVLQTVESLAQQLPVAALDAKGRPDIPYTSMWQHLFGMLSHCCTPETYNLVPPLARVAKQYGIRFPLDPAVFTLPLPFILWLSSKTPELPIVGWEWSRQESYILTLRVNLRAPRGDIITEIKDLLPMATGTMGKGRRADLDASQLRFRIWDLRKEGMSARAIAEQLLSSEFETDQKRGGPPEDYASVQKVYDLEKAAQRLIDNVKK